jgi:GH25 family lysozyme M1 (1,4-beta-N-acetylmuramidase)
VVAGVALVAVLAAVVAVKSADAGTNPGRGSGGGHAQAGRMPGSVRPVGPMVAPGDYPVKGIDVSSYQGNVNWSQVAAGGGVFAYAKATEGNGYLNPYFGQQYNGAKNAGLYAGAYDFARPDQRSGTSEADFFLDHAGYAHDGRTLPPMVDLEWGSATGVPSDCYYQSPAQMVTWIRDFVNEVRARTGQPTMIYTATSWWNECTGSNGSFGTNPLFIANYNGSPGVLPPGWSRWTLWQYSDQGSLPGDQDVFNGDLNALAALANGGSVQGDHVYGLSPDRAHVSVWNGSGSGPGSWTVIGGVATRIYAGGAGLFATNPNDGGISRYNGTPGSWTVIGGPGDSYAVSGDRLYGLSTDKAHVSVWNGTPGSWTVIGGVATRIYAGGAGLYATNPNDGSISRYNGTPGSWTVIGGPGNSYAIGATKVYGLAYGKSAVSVWTGAGTGPGSWSVIGGPADSITAGN